MNLYENRLKRAFIALSLVILLVVAMPNVVSAVSDGVDILGSLPNGAWETWQDGRMSFGEVVDVHRNPFLPSWEKKFEAQQAAFFGRGIERRDVRAATIVISASDSRNRRDADIYCDGDNDQVQINALAAAGYKIQLLEGTFTTGAPITKAVDNVTLEGQGKYSTIIVSTAIQYMLEVGGDGWTIRGIGFDETSATVGLLVNGHDHTLFDDCRIFNGTGTYGLYAKGAASYLRIYNCDFVDGNYHFVGREGVTHIQIHECIFSGGAATSISISGSDSSDILVSNNEFTGGVGSISISDTTNLIICDNWLIGVGYGPTFTDCTSAVIDGNHIRGLLDGTGFRFYTSSDIAITGNVFEDFSADCEAIDISGCENVSITGNSIYLSAAHGITVRLKNATLSRNVSIVGNVLKDIGIADDKSGILIYGGEDITISGNTLIETRAGAARHFYYGIDCAGNDVVRLNITGNTIRGMVYYGISQWAGRTGLDNWVIEGNLISGCDIGIYLIDGDDYLIADNRILDCTTSIDINDADVVRAMVTGTNSEGCTNDISYAAATDPFFTNNFDRNGVQWTVDDNIIAIEAWVTHATTNPSLGTIPAGSYIMRVHCHVTELFDSDGTDEITVGYDADPDSIATTIDVSTTGVKTVTFGTDEGYLATTRAVEAYYTAGGTAPTQGKAIIKIEFQRVPTQP